MGWERRQRGGLYYTRSRRVGGRVVREYVGAGELAAVAEMLDAEEREERQQREQAWKAERLDMAKLDDSLDALRKECESLVKAQLVLAGYHRHKGQWRLRRAEDAE
jgi:hypothetical protein